MERNRVKTWQVSRQNRCAPLFTESSSVLSQRGQKHDGVAMLMTPNHRPRASSPPSSWKLSLPFLLPPRLPLVPDHSRRPVPLLPFFFFSSFLASRQDHNVCARCAAPPIPSFIYDSSCNIKTLSPPIIDIRLQKDSLVVDKTVYTYRYFVSPSWNNNPLQEGINVPVPLLFYYWNWNTGETVLRGKRKEERERNAHVEANPSQLRARETIIFRAEGQRSFI